MSCYGVLMLTDQRTLLALHEAAQRLQRRLDGSLSTIKGISLAEYRMVRALADAPGHKLSRVALAEVVGMTASGVTRGLAPLEKIGYVQTVRGQRDARLALAELTAQGQELVADASGVLDDVAAAMFANATEASERRDEMVRLFADLVGA